MHGKNVVTSDDHKAGHVVGEQGDYYIVETGTLRKHKHVLPKAFAVERDDVLCATITWDILKDAPEVDSRGTIDRDAVAEHYGLAEHYEAPETEGYGETLPDDPAISAEVQGRADGVESPVEERASTRASLRPETEDPARAGLPGAQIRPTSGTD